MASIRNLLSSLATSVGPAPPRPSCTVAVPSVKEEPIMISRLDEVMFETFGKDSAVIPAGVVLTSLILVSGLVSLKSNNKTQQQMFMRLRVGTQGLTVLAMMASLAVQERQKALGLFRR